MSADALRAEVERLNRQARRLTEMLAQTLDELDAARDEGERLRQLVARLRVLVQTLANRASVSARGASGVVRCLECGVVGQEPLEHHGGCLALQARAMLIDGRSG